MNRHKHTDLELKLTLASAAQRRVMAVLACLKLLCPSADSPAQQQLANKILTLAHGEDAQFPAYVIST